MGLLCCGGVGGRGEPGLGQDAAGEGLVADERVDDRPPEGPEHAEGLGAAVGDAHDVGDRDEVVEGDGDDALADGGLDGAALGVVVAGGEVADGPGGPEGGPLLGVEVEAADDRAGRAVVGAADADEREVGLPGALERGRDGRLAQQRGVLTGDSSVAGAWRKR